MSTHEHREFGPFLSECGRRGIGRTKAYQLVKEGLLDSFTIGTKRYIYLDSLLSLPSRLAAASEAS